jgi:thioredoxin reductase
VTDEFYQTRIPGIYVIGELGGIGLIRNSVLQGIQSIDAVAAKSRNGAVDLDVVIVGAGPAGLGATLQAASQKLRYLTLEQYEVGGAILKYPRCKVVMTAPVHLPGYGKIQFRDVSKEDLLAEWKKIIEHTGIQVRTHRHVNKIIRHGKGFEVIAGSDRFLTSNVVLALGRRGTPRKLGVPGEHLSKVNYELDNPNDYGGRKCLVVGGGDSAIECALLLADAGAQVSLSYRQKNITRAKPRNRQLLEAAIARRKIRAYLPSVVKEITPEAVRVEVEGMEKNIFNDEVFIMAGGMLPFEFLKEIGIEMRTLYGEPMPGRKAA